jgi:regulator of sigma E protease
MIDLLTTALTFIVPFLLVLTLVVTVHELGHFLAARSFGVAIDRFSIGFGRAIARWTDRHGIEWRIGWIPFGGYVRFSGDENEASVPDQEGLEALRHDVIRREGPQALERYYHFKPIWQRAVIAAAGPAANFLLAIGLFALLLATLGEQVTKARVAAIEPGSVAAEAGFRPGDLIVQAAGKPVASFEDLMTTVRVRGGDVTTFVVERGGRTVTLTATPAWKDVPDRIRGAQRVGRLGIAASQDPADTIRVRYNPVEAVVGGAKRTWSVLTTTVYYLGRIVQGQVGADQISGPLGIANVTGKVAQFSAEGAPNLGVMLLVVTVNLVQLAALISVSVGFINLLPIPILDGGHLLFYAYEAVARRPLAARVQAAGYRVGLALVLGLMLFATWNDLQQLRVFKFLGRLFS